MTSGSTGESGTLLCLLVRTGRTTCAIPLAATRRIIRGHRVTPVPGSRPELAGLSEFGSEPLPVFDLAQLVDAEEGPHPEDPVTIVVSATDGELVGLRADEALQFARLRSAEIATAVNGIVVGEALVDDRAVRLLDPGRLGAIE